MRHVVAGKQSVSKSTTHTCEYNLEETEQGYLTGSYVCTLCGRRLKQSHWLRIYKATFRLH